MYAHASISLAHARGVVAIPVQALDRAEDKATVLVVNDGVIERRDVKIGLAAPDRVEILSGVKEHELVVVGSRSQLRPGTKVNPKIDSGAAARGER
jgi:hypothetical protein